MSQFFVRDDGIVIYYVDYPDLPWPAAPVSAEQKKKFEVLVDGVRKLHKEFDITITINGKVFNERSDQ